MRFHWVGILLLSALISQAEETVHVVLIGDSITEAPYLAAEQRLDQVLASKLKDIYSSQKIVVLNAGKSGATIPKYSASSYDSKVKNAVKEVDLALIEFGINDEDISTPEEFRKNLAGLCDRVLTDYPGAKIALWTSVCVKDRQWWKSQGSDAEENISKRHFAQTRALAAERGYLLVDTYKAMADAFKKGEWDLRVRNQKMSNTHYGKPVVDDSKDAERKADGELWFKDLHPNPRGIELIAATILQSFKNAFPGALPNEGKARP